MPHADIDITRMRLLSVLQLSALTHTGSLSPDKFDRAVLKDTGTPIYDLNGELLFYRVPVLLKKTDTQIAYIDIRANAVFHSSLLAIGEGYIWDEEKLRRHGISAARELRPDLKFTKTRFVAYSFPKLALQFLQGKEEILLLELESWVPVPNFQVRGPEIAPSNFERWSFIENAPHDDQATTRGHDLWDSLLSQASRGSNASATPEIVDPDNVKGQLVNSTSRVLNYSVDRMLDTPCFDGRSQETPEWCVAASVQMLLDFYRYNIDQSKIAAKLKLGTLAKPSGLSYDKEERVVTVLKSLTRNALIPTLTLNPTWDEFKNEINANRPLISFIPRHSRIVAGYVELNANTFGQADSRFLRVWDPWPPKQGSFNVLENFEIMTYRRTFTARLKM